MRLPWILVLGLAAASCGSGPPVAAPPPTPESPGSGAAARPDRAPPAAEPMTGTLPGDRVPDFRASVLRPGGGDRKEEVVSSRAAPATTLYLVMSAQCPYCNEVAPGLKEVEEVCVSGGVDVIYLYPSRSESDEEKVAWHREHGFRGGLVLDRDAAVSRTLEAMKTPTAYLVDRGGLLLYRGAVALPSEEGGPPEPFLSRAVEEHLAGRRIRTRLTEPEG